MDPKKRHQRYANMYPIIFVPSRLLGCQDVPEEDFPVILSGISRSLGLAWATSESIPVEVSGTHTFFICPNFESIKDGDPSFRDRREVLFFYIFILK